MATMPSWTDAGYGGNSQPTHTRAGFYFGTVATYSETGTSPLMALDHITPMQPLCIADIKAESTLLFSEILGDEITEEMLECYQNKMRECILVKSIFVFFYKFTSYIKDPKAPFKFTLQEVLQFYTCDKLLHVDIIQHCPLEHLHFNVLCLNRLEFCFHTENYPLL